MNETHTRASEHPVRPVLPRRKREHEPVLQPRDLELVKLFTYFRLATSSQLFPLLRGEFPDGYPNPYLLWRRLNQFASRRARYLARPPAQQLRLLAKRGNPEHIYALGNRGAELLRSQGFDLSRMDYDQKARALKVQSFDHPLLTTQTVAAILLALRVHPELRLVRLAPDGDFHERVTFFDGRSDITLPVHPDTFLVLENMTTEERTALFIEADRHTMPRTRTALRQSSFFKKTLAYFHYWQKGLQLREILGADDFIVLTVAETPQHAERLRQSAKLADPKQQGTELFWFTHAAELALDKPDCALFDPIWTTAAGTTGSLF